MTKKKTTKSTKPKKRVYRKKKNQSNIAKILFFFFIFFFISIGGLLYLRTVFNTSDYDLKKETALNNKIDEVDKALKEVLFNQGISANELQLSLTEKTNNGLKWNFKQGKTTIENNNIKIISSQLKNLTKIENVSLNMVDKTNSLSAELSIFGYKTHKLDFVLKEKKFATKKIGKKVKSNKIISSQDKQKIGQTSNKIINKKDKPKIVIIVDDVGQRKNAIDRLTEISYPINFAILPHLPYSKYAANKANENGKEVLLHLPMEPKYSSGYTAADAGQGALLVGHTKTQIERQLFQNLSAFPHIKGVNNHMGSKFTENKELMQLVFENLKDKNLYFVDSLTSNRSYGADIADQIGLRFIKRDVFLDDSRKGKKYMINQIENLIRIAEKNGVGVGICHTYPESIEVLSEYLPKIQDRVEIASVTTIFN